ncbi:MAG: hypothetical protein ABFC80_09175 [Coriobacteriales bacterium]|nr:hypothetical protein [Actinomycetes bacterium]
MDLTTKVCKTEEMNLERLFARIFVGLGGIFWMAAIFGMDFGYRDKGVFESAQSALLPLAIVVVILAIGWFYENLAAVLLLAGAVATVVWGIVASWETGVWFVMTAVLIAPMVVSAGLFILAARMQRICELKE